jgi:hypothetical protein
LLKEASRGFLEKSACPPSSESPLKKESTSYFSIANYAINLDSCGDVHCAFGPDLHQINADTQHGLERYLKILTAKRF